MKNKTKQKIGISILASAFVLSALIVSSALAYTPLLGTSAGGTGTSTAPVKGGIVVGAGTTSYGILATSTDGQVLTQSSTAPLGVVWATASAGGGSGNGNLFAPASSSIAAGATPYYPTAASTTVAVTSSVYQFPDGDTSIGTSTDCGLLCVVNASGTKTFVVATGTTNNNLFQVEYPTGTLPLLGVSSSGVPLFLGTSTPVAIGGASLALDACTSTTTIVPFALNTSTDIAGKTSPIVPLNQSIFQWNSWISQTGANTSTVTTQVCDSLAAGSTPTSTKYLFDIERVSGM
jgi:hypothetical protein